MANQPRYPVTGRRIPPEAVEQLKALEQRGVYLPQIIEMAYRQIMKRTAPPIPAIEIIEEGA